MNSIDKVLDGAVALGDEQKKLSQVNVEEIFRRDVVAPMKSLVASAPGWIKEIRAYKPTVEKVIAKVLKTPFTKDIPLGRLCDELRLLSENAGCLETGLKEYVALTSRCLLNRQGNFDRNAAANTLGALRGYFLCGPGTRKAMEALVKQIEDRLLVLMAARGASVGDPGVSVVTIEAPQKTDSAPGVVVDQWDPRLP
jgi:hypothetical protein